MSYLYETHCHSAQCSRCAQSSSTDLVRSYHAAGYAGLVLTDHFVTGNTAINRNTPWSEQMQRYYDAFLEAQQVGQTLDFDVIFGIEHACEGFEFLCYGIDLDFLQDNPDIPELSLEEFVERVHSIGGIVIQAHPFRYAPAGTPLRLDILDGLEVYNAANHPEGNQNALAVAPIHKIRTSGGDIHLATDARIGKAGIHLPHRVTDTHAFATALKSQTHGLLIDGKCSFGY